MNKNLINEPSDLRALLLQSVVNVIEGKMNISQANAVVGLSGEVHKSIKQQWDMNCYSNENLIIDHNEIKKLN
jgi:hypothetical protein